MSSAIVALLLALPGAALYAADASITEGSLCDAVPSELVDGLSPVRWGAPVVAVADLCVLEQAQDQEGPHSLALAWAPFIDFDAFEAANPDAVDVPVGDHPGLVAGSMLVVGLGEGILTVEADFADSAEGAGVDALEYAVAMAQLAIDYIGDTRPVAAPAEAAMLAAPPAVNDVSWSASIERSGAEIEAAGNADEMAVWQGLIDATDATFEQLHTLNASATNADEEVIGSYSAMRVAGTDTALFEPVALAWMRSVFGLEDEPSEQVSLGGKHVTVLSANGQTIGYVYVSGDTAYALALPEDVLAAVLASLP